jgi:mannose-6-phosphate isomerase-like protein (cupin superfamily)
VIIVPANTRQRIKNIGKNDLLFLAICSPRFQKKNYHEGSI